MAIYAVVDGAGLIANRIVADPGFPAPNGMTLVAEADTPYAIGGSLVGGHYTAPPAAPATPPMVPTEISDRQFFQQLAVQGLVTQAEALAAVKTGDIPPALQTLINGLPSDQQFGATMIVAGATAFNRNHPLTLAMGAAYGWSSDQIDTFWRAAAAL